MGRTQNSERSGDERIESQNDSPTETDGGTAAVAADDDTLLKEWAIFIGSLFTTVGLGIGFLWLILDQIGMSLYEPEVGDGSFHAWGFTSSMTVAMAGSVFIGVFLAWHLGARQNAMKVAAVSVLTGTFGLLMTRLFIRSTLSDSPLAFGGVFVNSLVTALAAAGVAATGVWIARNQAPTGSGLETARNAAPSGQLSD